MTGTWDLSQDLGLIESLIEQGSQQTITPEQFQKLESYRKWFEELLARHAAELPGDDLRRLAQLPSHVTLVVSGADWTAEGIRDWQGSREIDLGRVRKLAGAELSNRANRLRA
jgi:hypothetical protein